MDTELVRIESMVDYRLVMLWLMDLGCEPVLSKRGRDEYRFHVTRAGNHWSDGSTRFEACEHSVNGWIEAGMPKEGSS